MAWAADTSGGKTLDTNSANYRCQVAINSAAKVLCFVVLNVLGPGSTPTFSVRDNFGNSYTRIGSVLSAGASGLYKARYYCENAVGGAHHVITAEVTNGFSPSWAMAVLTFTGGKANGGAYDASNTNVGFLATPQSSNSVTVSSGNAVPGELLISAFSSVFNPASTPTEANGFTVAQSLWTSSSFPTFGTEAVGYKIVNAAGAVNASWSDTSGTSKNVCVSIDGFVAEPAAVLSANLLNTVRRQVVG